MSRDLSPVKSKASAFEMHGVTMAISQLSTVGPDDDLNDLLTLRMDVLPALSANIGCRGSD